MLTQYILIYVWWFNLPIDNHILMDVNLWKHFLFFRFGKNVQKLEKYGFKGNKIAKKIDAYSNESVIKNSYELSNYQHKYDKSCINIKDDGSALRKH